MLSLSHLARAARRPVAASLAVIALSDLMWTLVVLPATMRPRLRTVDELPRSSGPALILASPVDRKGEPAAVLRTRLETGLALYRAGKVGSLLVSGYDEEPVAMRRWLEQRGVPPPAITADFGAQRTQESLQRAGEVFGLTKLLIVTSDFHMPRTLWLAGHLGLEVEGVAASSAPIRRGMRVGVNLREYAARNRAILDVWFPPEPRARPGQGVTVR